MDQEEIEKVVLAYLEKRGFKQGGPAFQPEQHQSSNTFSTVQIDIDAANQILSFPEYVYIRFSNLIAMTYICKYGIRPFLLCCVCFSSNVSFVSLCGMWWTNMFDGPEIFISI